MSVRSLAALVGTDQDPSSQLDALADVAPALGGLVPTCIPAAEPSLWRFLTSLEELRQQFSSGTGRTEVTLSKVALFAARSDGVHLFQLLGLDTADWDAVPANAHLDCRDLGKISANMTWDVRHLSNLLGSDNVNDAEGYSVSISALASAIGQLVDNCRPEARDVMDDFAAAVETLVTAYRPGDQPAAVEANKSAFGDLRAAGIALYSELELDDTGWKVIPSTER